MTRIDATLGVKVVSKGTFSEAGAVEAGAVEAGAVDATTAPPGRDLGDRSGEAARISKRVEEFEGGGHGGGFGVGGGGGGGSCRVRKSGLEAAWSDGASGTGTGSRTNF